MIEISSNGRMIILLKGGICFARHFPQKINKSRGRTVMRTIPRSAFSIIFALFLCIGAQGCASITKGTKDTIQVEVSNCSEPMNCTATNKKGSWPFKAPGPVTFKKSDKELVIKCDDDGEVISQVVRPTKSAMVWGNVLLGGVIGGGVDASTDAHWETPDSITLFRNNCTHQHVLAQANQPSESNKTASLDANESRSQELQGCIDVCVANTNKTKEACFDSCLKEVD